ncbi:MAG TPA: hypothetical protein VN736_16115 [Candidatus Limnocylindrales bacterium]|nr:hypothetical protein [Candidatus Limnocylindrales bacterium]
MPDSLIEQELLVEVERAQRQLASCNARIRDAARVRLDDALRRLAELRPPPEENGGRCE